MPANEQHERADRDASTRSLGSPAVIFQPQVSPFVANDFRLRGHANAAAPFPRLECVLNVSLTEVVLARKHGFHLFREAKPLGRGTIMIEALSWTHAPTVRAVSSPRKVSTLRCSFCQAELGDNPELTTTDRERYGASTGTFCSPHCRNCVLALAALHPSPLATDDFASKRGVLTDRLLDLWRHGRGPDPGLVLRAAEHASCGLPNPN